MPRLTKYQAAGIGKGKIQAKTLTEEWESEGLQYLVYEDKTALYKRYLELTCDDFIENASDLVSLCKDGFIKQNGYQIMTDWQQVGDLETGRLISDGCDIALQEIEPSEPDHSLEAILNN